MCLQSVSLWAEATWYRLGGGADRAPEESPSGESILVESEIPAELPRQDEAAQERVLARR